MRNPIKELSIPNKHPTTDQLYTSLLLILPLMAKLINDINEEKNVVTDIEADIVIGLIPKLNNTGLIIIPPPIPRYVDNIPVNIEKNTNLIIFLLSQTISVEII